MEVNMNNEIIFSLTDIPYVCIAEYITNSKPIRHPDRTLDYHVLIYVTKGSLSVIEEGIEYTLSPGTLFFLKSGLHHWGKHYSENGTSWIYVHFFLKEPQNSHTTFQPYTSHILNQEFTLDSYQHNITLPKMINLINENTIEWKLHQLDSFFHSSNPMRGPYLNLLLTEILLNCYQLHHTLNQQSDNELSHRIIQYLEQTTHTSFRANDLEKHMNLSYKHLCAIFKRKTDMTLVEYHTNLRMNEAAKYLRESSLSIIELSERMGYQDPFYFSNVFKKVHGVSPRLYRDMRL